MLCAKSLQSCPTLCNSMQWSLPAPLTMGFSRQEYWSGLPCPPPGSLPNPGIEPASIVSPVLSGEFFTTNFPDGSDCKKPACNTGDLCSIPESGRSPGEGNGNSLQYSCQENPMDRGAWQALVPEVTKLDTTEQLTLSFLVPPEKYGKTNLGCFQNTESVSGAWWMEERERRWS